MYLKPDFGVFFTGEVEEADLHLIIENTLTVAASQLKYKADIEKR